MGIDKKKIDRINELYRKSKAEGLTSAERSEQALLRREYVEAFKQNLRGQLNNIDIKEKDEHFQHGMLKDDKYRDMIVSLINHYHVGSETFDFLGKTKRRVIEIGETQIYGGRNSNAPMTEYKFENVKLMLEQYDWLNKIVDKILKRVGIMRSMMLSIQAGKDTVFSANELTAELVFLINFCSYVSAFMDSYLSAHTGIIYSYE